MSPPRVIQCDPAIQINPELSARMRPFARLHRSRALRRLPWQGQSSWPTSSHFSVAASAPVRFKSSTYRIPFSLRHGSLLLNPLHQPAHETPMPPSAFSPLRDGDGFPSQRIPPARRAQPITAQASSPWYSARSSFAPRRPFVKFGWPPDHRSRSATVYQACCSDSRVSPEPSSTLSRATSTVSPTATSISPFSFLN